MNAKLTVAACAALFLSSMPGLAQSPIAEVLCAPSQDMHAKLTRQFGEARRATGVRGPEQIMELWSSETSGDWTLVISYASGTSCIVAMGEHLDMTRPENGAG